MVSMSSGADASVPGGEVITLPAAKTPVTSAILVGGKPAYLGSYPSMNEWQALAVLQQAKNAYNNGKGEWPSMKPQQRIEAIKRVVEAIKAERDVVIQRIMWEICKERSLAEDEFDRTITYIEKTIEKYGEMMKEKGVHQEELAYVSGRSIILWTRFSNLCSQNSFQEILLSINMPNMVYYWCTHFWNISRNCCLQG